MDVQLQANAGYEPLKRAIDGMLLALATHVRQQLA
jgi:hypothetical protein